MKAQILLIALFLWATPLWGQQRNLSQFTELAATPDATDWIFMWDTSSAVSKKVSRAWLLNGYQVQNEHLTDLADGSLTGTKVGFADTDSNFAATNVQAAIEELDNVNALGPNAADGKVAWSQLVGVPAGFADGTDDGGGGGGGSGTLSTIQSEGVQVGGSDIITLNFGPGISLVESPDTKITITLDGFLEGVAALSDPNDMAVIGWNDTTNQVTNLVLSSSHFSVVGDEISLLPQTTALPATRVGYGSGAGLITSEAPFWYDATLNTMFTGGVFLGSNSGAYADGGVSISNTVDGSLFLQGFAAGSVALERVAMRFGVAPNTISMTTDTGVTLWDYGSMAVAGPLNTYNATTWNGSRNFATEDAVRDKIESINLGTLTLPDAGLNHSLSIDTGVDFTNNRILTINIPDSNTVVEFPVNGMTVAGVDIANTFFSVNTINGTWIETPTAITGTAVNWAVANNTHSASANFTITLTGSPTSGQYCGFTVVNTAVTPITVTLPTGILAGYGNVAVTNFEVDAAAGGNNGRRTVYFQLLGSDTVIHLGGGGDAEGVGVTDGDKGDITVSASGETWLLNDTFQLNDPRLDAWVAGTVTHQPTLDAGYQVGGSVVSIFATGTGSGTATGTMTLTEYVETFSVTEAMTLSFAGSPVTGQRYEARFYSSSAFGVTIPEAFDIGAQANTTSFSVNGTAIAYFTRESGRWVVQLDGHVVATTGTGSWVKATSPTLVTPVLGAATATTPAPSSDTTAVATTEWVRDQFTRTGVRRTVYVNAGAMIPRTTNGAAPETVELPTNDIMLDSLNFDTTTEEGVGFWLTFPTAWDAGTITTKFHWTASSSTGTVKWDIAAASRGDLDGMDSALGTEQTAGADTFSAAANDMHVSPTTPAITIGNSPAVNRPIYFQITRDVAGDDLAADAKLLGVTIEYTESSTEPAAQ